MKKTILMMVGVALMLSMVSCDKFKKADSGFKYKFYKQGEGPTAQIGDVIEGTITISFEDSVFASTVGKSDKILMIEKPMFAGDLNEALLMVRAGDSVSFKINADSLRKFGQLPDFITDYLTYTFKVDRILDSAALAADLEAAAVAPRAEEMAKLAEYLEEKKIKTAPLESGLYFIENKKGSGPAVEVGKTVKFNYTGRLLSGQVFDSSIEDIATEAGVAYPGRTYEPLEIVVGVGNVIPGMDEGLLKMKQGGKATLIIPSKIGYGARGSGSIPPFSSMIFEIEVVSVK